jgi:hypothetical protein
MASACQHTPYNTTWATSTRRIGVYSEGERERSRDRAEGSDGGAQLAHRVGTGVEGVSTVIANGTGDRERGGRGRGGRDGMGGDCGGGTNNEADHVDHDLADFKVEVEGLLTLWEHRWQKQQQKMRRRGKQMTKQRPTRQQEGTKRRC